MRPRIQSRPLWFGAFLFAPPTPGGVVEHPASLPLQWRERATLLEQFGDPNTARLWRIAATELDRALEAFDAETLSLVEAARVSGYTPEHLGLLVKQGKIPNAGRPGAPRIRRADLPTKSSAKPGRPPNGAQPTGGRRTATISRR